MGCVNRTQHASFRTVSRRCAETGGCSHGGEKGCKAISSGRDAMASLQAASRAAGEPPLPQGLPRPQHVVGAQRAVHRPLDGGPLAELPALAGCARPRAADARLWQQHMYCGAQHVRGRKCPLYGTFIDVHYSNFKRIESGNTAISMLTSS